MMAAVLAAGEGRRLRDGGVEVAKPLVSVRKRPLLYHALASVAAAGAERAVVVVNQAAAADVRALLERRPPPLPSRLVVRTTASSLETFALAGRLLLDAQGRRAAVVSMVDGVFESAGLRRFAAAASRLREMANASKKGLVAVTTIDDDDRPLRVAFDRSGRISAIGPEAHASPYATAGLYLVPPELLEAGSRALAEGLGALRELLARTVSLGIGLEAVDVGRAYDVDRPDDIRAAEAVADEDLGS